MMLTQEVKLATMSGKVQTSNFDIGDSAIIIEYMSKTIYSNPIKTCVQEYCSNARDAHIELGKGNVPIKIKCPNRFDSTIKFQDFGPGISPDRMHNVFIRYGKSTKRNNNSEQGGFGMGAKSLIAYTDTFEIETIALEDGKKIKRNYSVIKEPGLAPKLVEFGEGEEISNDVSTGTTISANVKTDDFDKFKNEIISVCQFWNVRPEIEGCNPLPSWPVHEWSYEGANWKIGFKKNDYYRSQHSYLCIDGIPYPLDATALYEAAQKADVYELLTSKILLLFNVGQLSVSLSRDSLHYDTRTIEAIIKRLVEVKTWLESNIQSQIEKAATYKEAKILFSKLILTFDFKIIKSHVYWNNLIIDNSSLPVVDGYARKYYMDNGKIRQKRIYDISITEHSVLVQADEDSFFLSKIATLFDLYPNKNFQVFKPDDINTWAYKLGDVFKHLNPILTSTVAKKKMPRPVGLSSGIRGKRYMINECLTINPDGTTGEQDVNYKTDSGIYVIESRHSLEYPFYTKTEVYKFLDRFNITDSVYIIPSKYQSKITANSNMVPLKEFVKSKIAEYIKNEKNIEVFNSLSELEVHTFDKNNLNSSSTYEVLSKVIPHLNAEHNLVKWKNETEQYKLDYKAINANCAYVIGLAAQLGVAYPTNKIDHTNNSLYKAHVACEDIVKTIMSTFNTYELYNSPKEAKVWKAMAEFIEKMY